MARDLFHNVVKEALIKDGWTITHDPYPLHSRREGGLSTDIGAEKIILAENNAKRIAVEVKSFVHMSILHEFLKASGQYLSYSKIIVKNDPERFLYVAMPTFVYYRIIQYDWVVEVMEDLKMKVILYNSEKIIIEEWKE
jgi:XisH protein